MKLDWVMKIIYFLNFTQKIIFRNNKETTIDKLKIIMMTKVKKIWKVFGRFWIL